jgi:hypothetical protein
MNTNDPTANLILAQAAILATDIVFNIFEVLFNKDK